MKLAYFFLPFLPALTLTLTAALAASVSWLDDEDVPVPPGMSEDAGDFSSGAGAPPANSDSVASPGIRMRSPRSAGEGCPPGTMSAALSPDAKTLSILFDNFSVVAGAGASARRAMKLCQVAVPFDVPAGMQVQVVKIDFRGFNSIPERNSRTRYLMAYFFSDSATGQHLRRAVRRRFQFRGPLFEEYMLSTNIRGPNPPWSQCGRNVDLNIRTRIVAAGPPRGEEVMATIDSIDLVANPLVEYHLRWRPCRP